VVDGNNELTFSTDSAAKIFQAIQGHWLSASLGVIMQLKVPEILAGQDKPMEFTKVSPAPLTWAGQCLTLHASCLRAQSTETWHQSL